LPAPPSSTREVVFFGTPEIAAQVLSDLLDAGVRIVAVVTTPDKRRGRGTATDASPAKKVAVERGVPVIETIDAVVEFLADHGTDGVTGVVVAYGRIIREPLLSLIPLVNLHFSLLPRWRGAAPVERAILAGDAETGSTIMQIEAGLDTGPMYGVERTAINDDETVDELRSRLGKIGAGQLLRYLTEGFPAPKAQVGEALHADKIGADDLLINWQRAAVDVKRTVRLGGAFTYFRGQRLKVHRVSVVVDSEGGPPGSVLAAEKSGVSVATLSGTVRLEVVQPEGKKPMPAGDWANGVRPSVGETFGSD
jgi:methionyl-tRNA formyltransferase